MAGITTHVLDTARGKPAAGVSVTLEIQRGGWDLVGQGVTDADGRLQTLTDGVEVEAATYRLTFATGGPFFPEVAIVFHVSDPAQHYHVPLLLSPYGYSTYRGS
ncbi:MAG TPA: hydroxyisourate hydrolase [Thermoanaerobaculia bacterium]|nr:hydroxyisourate hydrolase [Thermoanaerobaculia bacterium]